MQESKAKYKSDLQSRQSQLTADRIRRRDGGTAHFRRRWSGHKPCLATALGEVGKALGLGCLGTLSKSVWSQGEQKITRKLGFGVPVSFESMKMTGKLY